MSHEMENPTEIHSEGPDNIVPMKVPDDSPITCDDNEMAERLREAQEMSKMLSQHIETTAPEKLASPIPTLSKKEDTGAKKPETKAQIIAKIMALQQNLHLSNPRPESHFQRMNKPELTEHLMWLTNKAANNIRGVTEELKTQTAVTMAAEKAEEEQEEAENEEEGAKPLVISKSAGAQQLFNMNMLIVRCAELASVNLDMKGKIGSNLEGLSKDCMDNQDELRKILAQIYEENSASIAQYLSPINQYFMFMSTIAVNRLAINKFKEDDAKK